MRVFRLKKNRALVSVLVMPLFVSSFLSFSTPLQAAPIVSSPANNVPATNSFASSIMIPEMPQDLIRLEKKLGGVATKLILDVENADRVYLLSETSNGQTLTMRYIYDDALCTVTLLLSQVTEGEAPRFTQYYRYALGPNDSLELILEEGWMKDNVLNPSRVYDYFAGAVKIRSFDRTGKILKIESSEGSKRILVYSREGKLLTVQEVRSTGSVSFYDQIAGGAETLGRPFAKFLDDALYVLPGRDKEKRFASTGSSRPRFGEAAPWGREDDSQGQNTHFLLWLESAHPLRAGPVGGLL